VGVESADSQKLGADRGNLSKLLFLIGLAFAVTPWASPPAALALGLLFGLTVTHPYRALSESLSKVLLKICVIGLGFGMDLRKVLEAGRSGFLYTFLGICFVLVGGLVLGRLLRVPQRNSFLISVGTGICGGSAIAAVGPVIEATSEEMSVALGTVFVLNAVALVVFPMIGLAAGLTQEQFGLWAALAIHDTSSVVGAGIKYGPEALAIATTVKLARALWIAPLALMTGIVRHKNARIKLPWFIPLFIVAAVINTYMPVGLPVYSRVTVLAKIGLLVTLYLIGSNISRATLKAVGTRPLLQGTLLWVVVSMLSLVLISSGIIAV
jgi:uncharacterized integral membrane protein (TIGR00698 family)